MDRPPAAESHPARAPHLQHVAASRKLNTTAGAAANGPPLHLHFYSTKASRIRERRSRPRYNTVVTPQRRARAAPASRWNCCTAGRCCSG